MADHRLTKFAFPLMAAGLGVVGFLLVLELGIRLLVPSSRWQFREPTENWQTDGEIGWVQKPSMREAVYQGEFGWTADLATNPDGLLPSNASRSRSPHTLRIMMFGDSTVVGRMVPESQRVHSKLQQIVQQKGVRTEVINAGVEGYSTDQEFLLMKRLIPLYNPDVVLLGICDNDFSQNMTTSAYGSPKSKFTVRGTNVIGFVQPPPGNIHQMSAPLIRRIVRHSALYRFFLPQIYILRVKYLDLSAKHAIPDLPPEFYFHPQFAAPGEFETMEALLREMQKLADAYRAQFMIYDHPSLNETWDPYIARTIQHFHLRPASYDRYALEKKMQQIAARNGIQFCPLVKYFSENQSRGPFHLIPRDPHCNPAGYQLTAEALGECLRSTL